MPSESALVHNTWDPKASVPELSLLRKPSILWFGASPPLARLPRMGGTGLRPQ